VTIFGYVRVSSKDQDFNGQIEALNKAGCAKVFAEKVSGARADNRKELARALRALAPGDTLIVTRLDRLARSTRDLLNTLDAVAKAGATFKSLADTWADTTTPHGKLMLTILGGLAEFELAQGMAGCAPRPLAFVLVGSPSLRPTNARKHWSGLRRVIASYQSPAPWALIGARSADCKSCLRRPFKRPYVFILGAQVGA
jgi:Resolvase, N terminal domain